MGATLGVTPGRKPWDVYDKNESANLVMDSEAVLSKLASTLIQDMDSVTMSKTKDFDDTTTTAITYTAGQYIYDTIQGLLYECVQNSTVGILLTNGTYFTQVTANSIIFTNSPAHYLNGKDVNGFNIAKDTLNLSLDLSSVEDGIKYIGVEKDTNTVVAYDEVTFDLVNGTTNAPNPTCFIPYPVQVQGGVVQDILFDLEKLPDNMMSDLTVDGKLTTEDIEITDRPVFTGYAGGTNIQAPGVIFDWTVEVDTHNAYNNGLWTCPKDGWYKFNPRVWNKHGNTTNTAVNSHMYINGAVEVSFYSQGTNSQFYIGIEPTIMKELKKGDTMYIESVVASSTHHVYFIDGTRYTNITITYEGK